MTERLSPTEKPEPVDEGKNVGPFRASTCVLCRVRKSSRRGEHVWPRWYLRSGLHSPGPYPWTLNGEPILKRNGQPLAPDELTRVKIPMCPPCNSVLGRRFETTTAGLVRNVFSDPTVTLGIDETERVALWLLKTWLLLSHPEVHYAQPLVDRLDIIRERHALPQESYSWLITGDDPPPGISLWASRTFDDGSTERSGPVIPLPVVEADGDVIRFHAHSVTVHDLTIALVFHPHWAVQYPGESAGRAVRLWPNGGPVDLGELEPGPLSEDPLWSEGWRVVFKDGVFGVAELPPLTATADPLGFFIGMARAGLIQGFGH